MTGEYHLTNSRDVYDGLRLRTSHIPKAIIALPSINASLVKKAIFTTGFAYALLKKGRSRPS
ncbi:hypothetical protein [Argonema galeatum]|uniref:hypothetical protein n=1 Tax=Argonema galeatum TaxID=2942762 RepID=UPI0020139E88|nr:hypothetical protein [Argonema galeatum]MCL1466605.1 hypothetical protein [Argonema galeatum A003/A1]